VQEKGKRMRHTAVNIYRPGALLALFVAAVLAAGLLALVGAKPAGAAEPTFAPAPNNPFPVGSTPTTVTNADFDGDGKMDLAAQNSGSNSVSALLGNGDGSFKEKQDFAVGSGPSAVTSADLDEDGKADLAVANWSSNNVSVLLGNGDGSFKARQDFAVGPTPSSVISADFNGDGISDLAVANSSLNGVGVFLGQDSNADGKGDGTFKTNQTEPYPINPPCTGDLCSLQNMADPNQIITADFNGDGKADLATANLGRCGPLGICNPGGVSVLLGKGDGTFQTAKVPTRGTPILSITAANLVAGTSVDLVAAELNNKVVRVMGGNGDGTFSAGQVFAVGSDPSAVTSADLDGDNKADDLAVSNFGSDNVSVLLNDDTGGFQAAQNFLAGDGPIFVIGAGLNADSFADLAVANQNSNNVWVLLDTQGVDTTAPTVSGVSPVAQTQNVLRSANVTATFSEAMAPATLNSPASTFTLKAPNGSSVPATVSYDDATKTATLNPGSDLAANTIYAATVTTGAKDLAGNALDQDPSATGDQQKSWSFTTAAPQPLPCTKTGTANAETISGTSGDDVICAGGGNDTVNGLGGNDTIKGEGGADKLLGGVGDDSLDGGVGNDTAIFSGSPAAITASLTTNTASGEGSDTLTGVENLTGSSKNDALTGSNANNTINGGGGADTLDGLDGVDKLTGGGANDTARGGSGNDTVTGSGGADNLSGEAGDDTVNSRDSVSGNDSLDGGSHVNGDTAITDATERSIVGFP
jgi:Ca2+-binding RTX toxin-like protein